MIRFNQEITNDLVDDAGGHRQLVEHVIVGIKH
jgi:hypothetical protein